MIKQVINFEWTFCKQRYKFNWPAIIIIGGGFLAVGLYQYFYY
jgi:hypothetical protein